jgi:hypothetical protein
MPEDGAASLADPAGNPLFLTLSSNSAFKNPSSSRLQLNALGSRWGLSFPHHIFSSAFISS